MTAFTSDLLRGIFLFLFLWPVLSISPTKKPTLSPSFRPSKASSASPSKKPTLSPTVKSSIMPSGKSTKKGFVYSKSSTWATKVNPVWYYNWGSASTVGVSGIPFVPMVWGKNTALPAKGSAIVLGFNEPDGSSQSNLTPSQALQLWKARIEPLGAGQYGSPATAENPVTGSSQWLKTFLAGNATYVPRVDFICVHRYAGADVTNFLNFIDNIWTTYKKPIWVTEYAVADWSATTKSTKYTVQQVIDFMKGTISGMESRSYVQRYSWKTRTTDDPNMWFSSIFYPNGTLTKLGQIYANI